MKYTGTDENTEKILQEAFEPATLSTEYRDQLLKNLIVTASGNMKTSNKSLWKKPDLWVAVAVVVVLAVIGYGIWLPYSVWDKLTS
ncbi:MAG: hypothetical protein ABH934_02785 [Chloroflexota bacterium]